MSESNVGFAAIKPQLDHRFCVAPMLDWTDRHCRYFHRLLSQRAVLYTEMVTTGAIEFSARDHLLFNPQEHPVALQLGGSDVEAMTRSAVLAQQRGYDEVNINVGCPSDRVQNGSFGACLMAEPELVAACVSSMQAQVDIPVTVKSRIGIDDFDDYAFLTRFIRLNYEAGCRIFIVHARKAWLKGLSPKENREIPPLDYERVYQLKQDFPDCRIVINGGITSIEQCRTLLQHVDGVMVGREAYANPYLLAEVDNAIYQAGTTALTRRQVVEKMLPYIQAHIDNGGRLHHISRHMLGLFHQQPRARLWRQILSQQGHLPDAGVDTLRRALDAVSRPNPD